MIKVKVIGLVWRNDQLLLAQVEDDRGQVEGLRPLGGSVEFGETRHIALQREFEEELGCGITITGPWHSFENIYEHEGAVGHEFVFAANVRLSDEQLYRRDTIRFVEMHSIAGQARWYAPTSLPAGVHLYPTGLLSLIKAGTVLAGG